MPNSTLPTKSFIACSNCCSWSEARSPGVDAPALLNMQSSRPKRSTARSTSAAISASCMTSARANTALPPSNRASRSPRSADRPAMTTRAPSAANSRAVASPMPLVAPVMIATLPSSLPAIAPPPNAKRAVARTARLAFQSSRNVQAWLTPVAAAPCRRFPVVAGPCRRSERRTNAALPARSRLHAPAACRRAGP